MNTLGRDVRTKSNILIEQWSDGNFYVVKDRFNNTPTPYYVHPNQMVKLLRETIGVVVVNHKTTGTHMKFI